MRVKILFLLAIFSGSALASQSFQAINVNAASKEQIMVLPGVGEKLAMRIVSHRDKNGQFASLDDLLLVKGLHPKLLSELSGRIELRRGKESSRSTPEVRKADGQTNISKEQEIKSLIEKFDREPKAKEVQEQALRYAAAEPSRVDEWMHRARVAPSLPSLAVSTGKGLDSDASVREKIGDASVYSKKDSSDFSINVKLEWKFSDLLFNRNELFVARESFRMAVIRERILSDVTKAYIERRRTQLKSVASNTLQPLERAELNLRLDELNAVLDALTGGWFSEQVAIS